MLLFTTKYILIKNMKCIEKMSNVNNIMSSKTYVTVYVTKLFILFRYSYLLCGKFSPCK